MAPIATASLPVGGIANICKSFLRDDFTFVVGGIEHKCDRILADILSPAIAKIHAMDPTLDRFVVTTDSSAKMSKFFGHLLRTGESTFSIEESKNVLSILRILGNEKLLEDVRKQICPHHKLQVNTILEDLCKCFSLGVVNSEMIDFAAKNFAELIDEVDTMFPIELLMHILESPSLVLKDESSLFAFVQKQIDQRGDEAKNLLGYVNLIYLSTDDIEELLSMITYEELDAQMWERICERLLFDISPLVTKIGQDRFESTFKIFEPQEGHYFEGIMNFLNTLGKGNCVENGLVQVGGSEPAEEASVANLFNYEDFTGKSRFAFEDEKDGSFTIDFGDRRVSITHYAMHVRAEYGKNNHQPKNWRIEATENGENWDVIDERSNDESLNAQNASALFECENKTSKNYKIIRYVITGPDHFNCHYSTFTGLEFFGRISSD